MKQAVQPDAGQAQRTAESTRSRPAPQQTAAPGGHLAQLAAMINSSPRVQALAQLKEDIQRTAQLKIGIAGTLAHGDRAAGIDDALEDHDSSAAESSSACGCSSKPAAVEPQHKKLPAQKKSDSTEPSAPAQLEERPASPPNRTGLPDRLKTRVESLSGVSLESVKVHYNSDKPAQLNALAYAQGSDIHVGPGQEEHLPHEAWHVVQQAQGRVRPTMQMKAGVPVNDDRGLEKEANVMGERALQAKADHSATRAQREETSKPSNTSPSRQLSTGGEHHFSSCQLQSESVVQRTIWRWNGEAARWDVYYATNNNEEPPYQGKAGDIYDNEATLGKADINQSEADAIARDKAPKVRDLLIRAFEDANIVKKQKNRNMFNLLLDIGAEEIGKWGPLSAVTFKDNLINSLAYTSCHNTAVKLMKRLSATPQGIGPYLGKDKESAQNESDGAWLTEISLRLKTTIGDDIAQGNRSVYEVHCGGHGFTILVRYGEAEILQSFANAISLVERMEQGSLVFDSAKIGQIVLALASANEAIRDDAAQAIASCNAAIFGLTPHPKFQYRWRRQALIADRELVELFKTDMENGFKSIKKLKLLDLL